MTEVSVHIPDEVADFWKEYGISPKEILELALRREPWFEEGQRGKEPELGIAVQQFTRDIQIVLKRAPVHYEHLSRKVRCVRLAPFKARYEIAHRQLWFNLAGAYEWWREKEADTVLSKSILREALPRGTTKRQWICDSTVYAHGIAHPKDIGAAMALPEELQEGDIEWCTEF